MQLRETTEDDGCLRDIARGTRERRSEHSRYVRSIFEYGGCCGIDRGNGD